MIIAIGVLFCIVGFAAGALFVFIAAAIITHGLENER
jgi:hypothetical protein